MRRSDHLRERYGVELVDGGPGVISLDAARLRLGLKDVIATMDELCDKVEKLPAGVQRRVREELASRLSPEEEDG